MPKTYRVQPEQLFRLVLESHAVDIAELGLPEGTTLLRDPVTEKWPEHYVGAVVHLAPSGTSVRRVGSSPVWVTQEHIAPEHVSFYKQEGTEEIS